MGFINITNIEDGQVASANVFNQRYGAIADVLNGNVDAENIKNGSVTQAKLAPNTLESMWPVGSVYMNADDSTNPGTLIGFGTWTNFATGRMLVGVDESDSDFNASNKTGGAKRVSLTGAQNGPHTHAVDPPSTGTSSNGSHNHKVPSVAFKASSTVGLTNYDTDSFTWGDRWTSTDGNHSHTVNIPSFTSGSSGSGDSHENMSPYVTVYMWKRTS